MQCIDLTHCPCTAPVSLVPFALRLLEAELPARLGKPRATFDKLYNLFDYCNKHLEAGPKLPPAASHDVSVHDSCFWVACPTSSHIVLLNAQGCGGVQAWDEYKGLRNHAHCVLGVLGAAQ